MPSNPANFAFSPHASADLRDASDFYESERSGLALEFIDEFEMALAKVLEAPQRWPELEPGIRRFRMSRFPYAIIYRNTPPKFVQILAVFDLRRQPGSWRR